MEQLFELPEPEWLDLSKIRARALEFFKDSSPAEVESALVTTFFDGTIPTRGRLNGRLGPLPVVLWDPGTLCAISWIGNCFAARHRSRWGNDAQEYRVIDVQGSRRGLEAWIRRAVRAAGRPKLAVVNGAALIA